MRAPALSPRFSPTNYPLVRRLNCSTLSVLKPLHTGRVNGVNVSIFPNAEKNQPEPAAIAAAQEDVVRLFAGLNQGQATLTIMAWGDTMTAAWQHRAKEISQHLQEKPHLFTEFFGGAFFAQGDEFAGVANDSPHSAVPYFLRYFIDQIVIPDAAKVDILRENNFFFFNGQNSEADEKTRFYRFVKEAAKIRGHADVDLPLGQPLSIAGLRLEATFGMGPKGHVLFNEKENGPFRFLPFGKIPLCAETRQRKDASYASDFSHAFTLRGETFWAERVNFIVTRSNKVDEVYDAFAVPCTPDNQSENFSPAREFQHHPNVHLYCSLAAGQRLLPFLS